MSEPKYSESSKVVVFRRRILDMFFDQSMRDSGHERYNEVSSEADDACIMHLLFACCFGDQNSAIITAMTYKDTVSVYRFFM
jgi:hypothetical protein